MAILSRMLLSLIGQKPGAPVQLTPYALQRLTEQRGNVNPMTLTPTRGIQIQSNQVIPPPLPSQPPVAPPQTSRTLPVSNIPPQTGNLSIPPQDNAYNQKQQGITPPQENPITKFNLAIIEMLKQAQQGLPTEDMFKRQTELKRQEIGARTEVTPEMMGLAPSQQESILKARAGEFQPEQDAISAKIKASDARLTHFENLLGEARQLGESMTKSVVKAITPEVIEGYKRMIEAGGLPSSIPDEIRGQIIAGIPSESWSKWGEENRKGIRAGVSGTSNVISDNERALLGQFQQSPIVKDYNLVISQKLYMDNVIANGVGGPADLALVFSFMKGLDPNSVVRETEYETAAKSGNIFRGWAAKFNGYMNENGGFLPENVRKEFQNLVNQKLKSQQIAYDNYARAYKGIAERQGLNPDNVVPDFSGALVSSDLATKVAEKGYDYNAMKSDGHSDEEIKDALGL